MYSKSHANESRHIYKLYSLNDERMYSKSKKNYILRQSEYFN